MKPIRFSAAAREELDKALEHYSRQRSGLERDFHAEFGRVVECIRDSPVFYPQYDTLPARQAILNRFPYSVIYQEFTDFLLILAVASGWIYLIATRPNNQFVYITPYLVTLIVVSARGQALRPPAQAGLPWRKGMQV